jgi:hypothetical protein
MPREGGYGGWEGDLEGFEGFLRNLDEFRNLGKIMKIFEYLCESMKFEENS